MDKTHKELQSLLPYCTVLLGGSHMRGQSTSFSDVDFFLVPNNLFGFLRLLFSRKSIKSKAPEKSHCNIHITMPVWLQRHFFWVYGKDIRGKVHNHAILPKVLAYNNLKMAYKTAILIHSFSLQGNTKAQNHYTNKLITYLRLLELGCSSIRSSLQKEIDLFDQKAILSLLPSDALTKDINSSTPLYSFSNILLSLHHKHRQHFEFFTSPYLLRIFQFLLALTLGHPRSATHILFARDIHMLPRYMREALSSQDTNTPQRALNYAKFTYFWIVIR